MFGDEDILLNVSRNVDLGRNVLSAVVTMMSLRAIPAMNEKYYRYICIYIYIYIYITSFHSI